MKLVKLVWAILTCFFALVGSIIGYQVGSWYVKWPAISSTMTQRPVVQAFVVAAMTSLFVLCSSFLGSWVARRVTDITVELNQVSATDKMASVLGLLLGFIFALLISYPLTRFPTNNGWMNAGIIIAAMIIFGYLGLSITMGMKEEFLKVFPRLALVEEPEKVEETKLHPKLLDTNVIIDGRMADICETGFIEGSVYIPSFVLNELQHIADSADSLRRARGRRGLDVLNRMRKDRHINVEIFDKIPPSVEHIDTVDTKLVHLAKELEASIITNDYNLNKIAELHGVPVLNINELANALKPVVLPGEEMSVHIVKEGKEHAQGVGYLEDGTMVVVEEGKPRIGQVIDVVITSVYQTVAGKMIFAEPKGGSVAVKGNHDDLFGDRDGNSPSSGSRRPRRR
jgi:uncharacterized protein YacL